MPHPQYRAGSSDHLTWIRQRVRAYLDAGGHSSRDAFLSSERARRSGGEWVTERDLQKHGGWGVVGALAARVPGLDVPVEPDSLDFDDVPDTAPSAMPYPAVPEGHYVKGLSTYHDGEGRPVRQWVKTAREEKERAEILAQLIADFDGEIPVAPPVAPPTETVDHLLALYPLGDPHLGLRNRNGYGLEKGAAMLTGAVYDLVRRGPRTKRAIVANLGDYLHSDDPTNRTRRSGNALDVDGDWYEILQVGRDVFIGMIRAALEHHEDVHVVCMPGNHDDLCGLFLTLLVDAHFREEPRVTVDKSGDAYQWYEWGRNLLGFAHGDKCKREKLPAVMANRQKEAWGRTDNRYFYLGHEHHTRRVEIGGVVLETMRTMTEPDSYTDGAGYISGRDLNRIVLHHDYGEVGRETVSAAMLTAKLEAA